MRPSPTPTICVIGTWHQGAVAAACLADLGFSVIAADPDSSLIDKLATGNAGVFEPGLDDLLARGIASENLRFTHDLTSCCKGCPFVFIMFDTPVDEQDLSDLTGIFAALDAITPTLEPGVVLYVTAQVPVGTCDQIKARIQKTRPDLEFGIAYSPENLRLGQAIKVYREPLLPVLGSDQEWVLESLEALLLPFEVQWQRVSLRTAEMTKHALNSFLAAQITLGNEIGNLCDEVGADGARIAQLLRLEPRVGAKAMLMPGLAFSGGTIARDLQALRRLGDQTVCDTKFLDGIWESNKSQNHLVLRKIRKFLGSDLTGQTVTVLGLTYKPGTSTLRRSASLEIINDLVAAGLTVRAHDPKADRDELKKTRGFTFFEDPYTALNGARMAIILTGWPEYRDLDFQKVRAEMADSGFIDTQNMFQAEELTALGFVYMDIGRGRGAI